ncbi:MAG: hypothetical protein IT449_18650 [Phycisphaerales bacterium]|nr:hypothetical protein [Phycisphaerales bacterium]
MNTLRLGLPLLTVLAALFLAGLVLLIRGLRGRRIGTDPHCRKCRYNLTGLTSDKCPECGTSLGSTTVLIGRPSRRRRALGGGCVLMLASLSVPAYLGYKRLRAINPYPCYPTSWLIDAASRDVNPALKELVARVQAQSVPDAALRRLVAAALDKQSRAARSHAVEGWLSILALTFAQGRLSLELQDRYFDQMGIVSLEVRPIVLEGDPVVCAVRRTGVGSVALKRFGGCEMVIRDAYLGLDGGAADLRWAGPEPPFSNDWNSASIHSLHRPDLQPGRHVLEWYGCIEATKSTDGQGHQEVVWSKWVEITKDFEIWPLENVDPIQWVFDPSLQQVLKNHFQVSKVTASRITFEGGYTELRMRAELKVAQPLPVDIAFSTWFSVPGGELSRGRDVGAFTSSQGRIRMATDAWGEVRPFNPEDRIELVLTADRTALEHSMETYTAWWGELRFGPLEINEFRQIKPNGDWEKITREDFFDRMREDLQLHRIIE